MPEKVTVRDDLKVIYVESFGDVSIEDLKVSLQEVIKLRRVTGYNRVLVNASEETSLPSPFAVFQFASQLAESMRTLKIGVIRSKKLQEELRFLETVSRNRGAEIELFDTEESTVAWLNNGSGPNGGK